MHENQEKTVKKAVINLGKYDAIAGLTFKCLSLVNRLADLFVDPMPFDRLSKVGKNWLKA